MERREEPEVNGLVLHRKGRELRNEATKQGLGSDYIRPANYYNTGDRKTRSSGADRCSLSRDLWLKLATGNVAVHCTNTGASYDTPRPAQLHHLSISQKPQLDPSRHLWVLYGVSSYSNRAEPSQAELLHYGKPRASCHRIYPSYG